MEATTKQPAPVTSEELREAERGLTRLLYAKRFPGEWIERNVPDLMAQAYSDLASRIARGRKDENVNLLVVIGYRKATKLVDRQRKRPIDTSIEKFSHLADEFTPTPEEEAIHQDRQERVMAAIGQLPERDRKLLALVYFEDKSIRDAGRSVGLGKSSADRHHRAALERLEVLLDRSLLAPEIAIPAFIAAGHPSAPEVALRWVQGFAETMYEATLSATGRLAPLGESGSAVAMGGGGRTLATVGACGVAALACIAGAMGVVGPALGPSNPISHRDHTPATVRPRSTTEVDEAPLRAIGSQVSAPRSQGHLARHGSKQSKPSGPSSLHNQRSRISIPGTSAPPPTPKETVDEFGIERGEVESQGTSGGSPGADENAPLSPESSSAQLSGGGAVSSPSHSDRNGVDPEFGM